MTTPLTAPASTPAAAPTSRQARVRLALLAALLASALAALALTVAWLWPAAPSRVIDVPLADLEVGVPRFIRPFDMGSNKGHAFGIWLVRSDERSVSAFSSALPHASTCGLEVRTIEVNEPVAVGPGPLATPLPARLDALGRPIRSAPQFVTGFRDACEPASFFLDGTANWTWAVPIRSLDYFRTSVVGSVVRIDASTVFIEDCRRGEARGDCRTRALPVTARNRQPYR